MRTRNLAAGILAAALAAYPGSAPAQLVPRLVDYPVTHTSACAVDQSTHLVEQHSVTFVQRVRRDDFRVFAAPGCRDGSLLFTVTFLDGRCANYSWAAGVARDVAVDPCAFATRTLGSL